jgi:hypothetical protein
LGYQGQGAESSEENYTKESRKINDTDLRWNAYERIHTEGDRVYTKVA